MKKILKYALIAFVGVLAFLTGQTVHESIEIHRRVNAFMAKGTLQEDLSSDTIKYYKVSHETYHKDEFYRPPFFAGDLTQPGAEGDILITRDSPLVTLPGIHQFVSFYFGGHAAYVGPNNKLYEIIGIPDYDESFLKVYFKGGRSTHVTDVDNYWLDSNFRNSNEPEYKVYGSYYRKNWIGVRVKGVSFEEIQQVNDFMQNLVDMQAQYNFQFIFNTTNRYYCTDMMARGISTIINNNGRMKYNLNQDGIAVTSNDLILSKDVYISYYVRTDKNNVKHVYYIG